MVAGYEQAFAAVGGLIGVEVAPRKREERARERILLRDRYQCYITNSSVALRVQLAS